MSPMVRRKWFIVGVSTAVLLFVAVTIWRGNRTHEEEPESNRPMPVYTVLPEKENLSNILSFSTLLEAESSVMVLPRVPGTLIEVLVEEGELVTADEVLARIDPEPYRLELISAESNWLLAESSYSRLERLHANAGASRQQLDEAKTAKDAAETLYELAKIQHEYSDIRSPIDGKILARYGEVGAMASPENPVFFLASDGIPQVTIQVPEKYWDSFRNPEYLSVRVGRPEDGDADFVDARIDRISSTVSPLDRTFQVVCTMGAGVEKWPLGIRVSANIVINEKRDTWSLPLKSLTGDEGLWWIDPEKSTAHREMVPSIFRDSRRLAVPEEWSQRIFVLEGHHRLREGMPVTAYPAAGG